MKRKNIFVATANSPLHDQIVELIQQEPGFERAGESSPHKELQDELEQIVPDLLVYEITDAYRFQPLEELSFPLPTIFLGSREADVLKSLHFHTVDFLLPHVGISNIRRAFTKYKQLKSLFVHHLLKESVPLTIQYPKKIFVEAGQKRRCLDISSILYLKADGDYTRIHSIDNFQYISSFGISELEKRLDPALFIRIHRSYIINSEYIRELYRDISKTYVLLQNKVELSIGRMYLPNLKELLF